MRLYNIASGVLLILPIIDFALAAPVLAHGDTLAGVDVVHMHRDVITALGKRVGEGELEKAAAEIFDTSGKSAESSDAHVSSSSATPAPDHGPVKEPPPPPNPESSTANPEHALVDPSSASSSVPTPESFDERINKAWVAHNAALLKAGPDTAHASEPMTGSFDDRITKMWNAHYDAFSKQGTMVHEPASNPASSTADHASKGPLSPSSTAPGSFDDRVDAGWASRYNKFLEKGGTDTSF